MFRLVLVIRCNVSWVAGHLKDEPFHIPQAQAYCRDAFTEWDPKITTPPGL